jgi:hypothetical protein
MTHPVVASETPDGAGVGLAGGRGRGARGWGQPFRGGPQPTL